MPPTEHSRVVLYCAAQLWTIVLIIWVCYSFTCQLPTHKCTPVEWPHTQIDESEIKLKLRPLPATWRRATIAIRTFLVFVAVAGCVAVVEGHDEPATNTTTAAVDSAPYKDFSLSPKGWVIVLSCVVLFWILLSILLACFCANTSQECHLCEQPVNSKLWESGKHWKTCAAEHERYLHDLPGGYIMQYRERSDLKQFNFNFVRSAAPFQNRYRNGS